MNKLCRYFICIPKFFCVVQGSYSFELFKFRDFPWLFPWLFRVFQDLRFSCQFQKFKTFTCFRAFFDLKQFNRHKRRHSPKCVPFTLLNYSPVSYIVFIFATAVNNLSNKTSIFHDFQGPTIKFHDFPGLEMKFINSMTFQVFHYPYEPCCLWLLYGWESFCDRGSGEFENDTMVETKCRVRLATNISQVFYGHMLVIPFQLYNVKHIHLLI